MFLKEQVRPCTMAQVTTYLLVSGLKEDERPERLPILKESEFEVEKRFKEKSDSCGAIRLLRQSPIEEHEPKQKIATELSKALPESTVTLCVTEERFGQIERLRTTVFKDGCHAGEIEHGSLYNVGGQQ